ncbi:MAG: recombination protein O N-terminal domain-containing protein [Planctomycetota bacterium]|nr:recombination protein O N-terminal domain-containing protein [Planctomycetota bacterium]
MPVRHDRALVLQRHPWSESSLVAHVVTAAHGRVHLLARGAFRTTSRFYCVLDLFDTLDLEWNQSPGRELADLRAGDVWKRRRHVAGSLAAFRAATTVLERSARASRVGPPDARLFARVESALDALDALATPADRSGAPGEDGDSPSEDALPVRPAGRPASASRAATSALAARSPTDTAADVELAHFELDYLDHLGFTPSLVLCAACGGPAPVAPGRDARVQFSAGAGGRLCARCAEEGRARGLRVGTLPVRVLDDARLLGTGNWPADAAPERIVRVRDWIERFLDYHLETRPRSHRAFLSVHNRNAPVERAVRPAP